jgi:hypothetical protein
MTLVCGQWSWFMPDLDAFEAEVRERIKQLASKDAEVRRKAAAWLGEAGDPSAITGLAHTYKHDNDKQVREAAAYSLGMFRALQAGLSNDNEHTLQLLQNVAAGKRGGRVPIATPTLVKVEVGLIALAVLLFVVGAVLPGILNAPPPTEGTPTNEQPTQVADVSDKDAATLFQEIRQTLTNVNNDALSLQTQFQAVIQGGTVDCAGFYNNPQPYQLSPNNASQFPQIVALVNDLNTAVSNLASAMQRYDAHCGGQTLTAAEVGAPMSNVVSVLQSVPTLQQAIADAEAAVQATEAPTSTPEVVNTEGPTAAPTPTVDVRPYRSDMLDILDRMTLPDGANSLLSRFWSDAAQGSTDGCRDVPPTIPNDVVLPPEVSQASLPLTRAMLQLNTGLAIVRDGWRAFSNACASNTAGAGAAIGLQQTALANEAFAQARAALDGMR